MKMLKIENQKMLTSRKFVTLCGRGFRDTDSNYFPHAQYRGRTIFLCTESCLGAFLADPDQFYKVHRNSEGNKSRVDSVGF